MPNPEIPGENQSEKGVFVHNLYMDCLFDEMRLARTEAMDKLVLALEYAAAIAADTWPNSLHTFNKNDGEILIMSTQIDVGNIGRCLNFIVNDMSHVGTFGEHQVDIYDFVIPLKFKSAAYKRTVAFRSQSDQFWNIHGSTGPVIINRFDSVTQTYGKDYALPTVRRTDVANNPIIDLIDETIAAEQLGAWLSLVSDISYEPYASRGI